MAKRKITKISQKLTGKKKKASAEELQAIAKRFRKHLRGTLVDHAELLYDDNGLPK
jgi:antitoxin VapB